MFLFSASDVNNPTTSRTISTTISTFWLSDVTIYIIIFVMLWEWSTNHNRPSHRTKCVLVPVRIRIIKRLQSCARYRGEYVYVTSLPHPGLHASKHRHLGILLTTGKFTFIDQYYTIYSWKNGFTFFLNRHQTCVCIYSPNQIFPQSIYFGEYSDRNQGISIDILSKPITI